MVRARGDLLDVRGLAVGQATDPSGRTGVTAVLLDGGAPTVVDVRGGASGTYDTASLALEATFGRRWAIFLSGGSLYGLDAARGVRQRLLETGRGLRVFDNPHLLTPISGAVIFDLPAKRGPVPDYGRLGRLAAARAGRRRLEQGRAGAGAGATVGKYLGRARGMPGGLGSASRSLGGGAHVGVLTVVNAVGAIRDPSSGRWVAGARAADGRVLPPTERPHARLAGRGTTLAIVATDLRLERGALARIAAIAHAGLGRAIVPYLTANDGDCLFAVSTGLRRPPAREPWPAAVTDRVGRLAADAAVEAVLRAVGPDGPRRR